MKFLTTVCVSPPGPEGHCLLLAGLHVCLKAQALQLRVIVQGAQVIDAVPEGGREETVKL